MQHGGAGASSGIGKKYGGGKWSILLRARALTPGGRAMDPACRMALRHQRHHFFLPAQQLCMPVGCERVLHAAHSDAQLHRSLRCVGVLAASWIRRKALGEARAMDRLRQRVSEEGRVRLCMNRTRVGPVHVVKMHVPCIQSARALCQNEYAVSLIHHPRPLNRRETHGFRNFH